MQKFIARESFRFSNGAIGWAPGGPFDGLGPFAKVQNCPIKGTATDIHAADAPEIRRTAYATGYADTYFSVPACTRYHGRYISGYLTSEDSDSGRAIVFVPHTSQHEKLPMSLAVTLERIREYLIKDSPLGRFESVGKWNAVRLFEKVWR